MHHTARPHVTNAGIPAGRPWPTIGVAGMLLVALLAVGCTQEDGRAEVADAIAGRLGAIAQPIWNTETAEPWPDPAAPLQAVRDHVSNVELPQTVANVEIPAGGGRGSADEDSAAVVFPVLVEPTEGGRYCIHVALTSSGTALGEVALNGDPDAGCDGADSDLMRRRDDLGT